MVKIKTTESKFKLDASVAGQMRVLLLGFVAVVAPTLMMASVLDGVENVKDTKEFNKNLYGTDKLSSADKKNLANDLYKNAIVCVAAFALTIAMINALRAAKRMNDAAAIRAARSYLMKLRAKNPMLKKYDYILNNDMALYNIAVGVANMLPLSRVVWFGAYWDNFRFSAEHVSPELIDALKHNVMAEFVDELQKCVEQTPHYMDKLTKLIDSSAKTFAFDKYMQNQQGR